MPKYPTIEPKRYKRSNLVQCKKGKELKGRRSCWYLYDCGLLGEFRLIAGTIEIASPYVKEQIVEYIHKGKIYYDKTEEPLQEYTPFSWR